jgi:hypothetical protein
MAASSAAVPQGVTSTPSGPMHWDMDREAPLTPKAISRSITFPGSTRCVYELASSWPRQRRH